MNEGYIKLYRSLLTHPLWTRERFTRGQAWADLLLLAAYADHDVVMGSKVVSVKAGEILTSTVKLAARWKWDRETVSRFFRSLECLNMVRIRTSRESETGYTLITLLNWPTYQGSDKHPLDLNPPSDPASDAPSDPASVPHPCHTIKKGKKGKNNNLAGEESPAGSPAGGKKASNPPNPDVKILIDHYYSTFMARFQSPPPLNGAKCGAIAKKLLAGRTLDEAKWLVTEHLSNPPDFYEGKNLYGLEHVLASAPTLLVRRAKLTRGE